MRILLEFLDEENLNNCISQLCFDYDKVVYFYFDHEMREMKKNGKYEALKTFNTETVNTESCFKKIENDNPETVSNAILKELNEKDSFDIDLSGGSVKFGYVIGSIISSHGFENVNIHCFDIEDGIYSQIYKEDITEKMVIKNKITVNDLIKLQASDISNDFYATNEYRPDLSVDNYKKNIQTLWKIVKDKPKEWNSFCSIPNETKSLEINKLYKQDDYIFKIFDKDERKNTYNEILKDLGKQKIVEILMLDSNFAIYKIILPEKQKGLFDYGGNIFELYVYSVALSTKAFSDCCVDVHLDWDGCFDNTPEEVKNEVDLILSNGYRPIFISCKNTDVNNLCIYEIDTVTRYYGGGFALPVIISSVKAKPAIRKRAEETGIVLIDNVANLSVEEFKNKLIALNQ